MMKNLTEWMSTGVGRAARIVAGLALIVVGLLAGGGWIALSIVGVIPTVAGLANFCLLAPFAGQPLKGAHH